MHLQRFRNKSIRFQLTVLVLFIIIPMVMFQTYDLHKSYSALYRHEVQENLELARATKTIFLGYVNSVLRAEAALLLSLSSKEYTDEEASQLLSRSDNEKDSFWALSLLNPQGRVTASSLSAMVGVDLSDRPYFEEIRQGKDWSISDLFIGRATGKPMVTISNSIRDEAGNLKWIMTASLTEDTIENEISFKRAKTGAISIVDRNGVLVFRFPRINVNWDERNWLKAYPFLQETLNGREYTGTAVAQYESRSRIVANVPLPFGWIAGAGRAEEEVVASVFSQLWAKIILFLFVLTFGLALAAAVSRQITKGALALRLQSDAIGRGEYIPKAQIHETKEFQTLSNSLEAMSSKIRAREEALLKSESQLRDLNENLDKMVKARTTDLVAANRALEERAQELRQLAGELTMAEQRERKRLSKVLHDGLQQYLVAAKLQLGALIEEASNGAAKETAKGIESLLAESIQVSRSLAAELSPQILHDGGILAGIEWLSNWMANKHGLNVHLVSEIDSPNLSEDAKVLLFECVRELLLNVVKHAKVDSAMVHIGQDGPEHLRIRVNDNGSGFECRWSLDSTDCNRGFGLVSIRERLQFIGGRFEVDSSPGQGARFSLIAPLAVNQSKTLESGLLHKESDKPHSQHQSPQSIRIRILLTDDHAVMREGLARLLAQESDFEVVGQASDGQEAVEMAEAVSPDVILMDISMPRMSGIDATRTIHTLHPEMRVIGLSLYQEEERAREMLDAGATFYITKSGPPAELKEAIRSCMRDKIMSASIHTVSFMQKA